MLSNSNKIKRAKAGLFYFCFYSAMDAVVNVALHIQQDQNNKFKMCFTSYSLLTEINQEAQSKAENCSFCGNSKACSVTNVH